MVKFAHIKTLTRRVTVAMEMNDQNKVVAYAIAICNPKDNFCRKIGRIKSEARLKSDKYRTELFVPVRINECLSTNFNLYSARIS